MNISGLWSKTTGTVDESDLSSIANARESRMFELEMVPHSHRERTATPSKGPYSRYRHGRRMFARPCARRSRPALHALLPGPIGVSAWIVLSLAATFSNSAASQDTKANLELTGTEPVQAHLRPMDARGLFTGKTISTQRKSFNGHWGDDFETLFFEGDLGEMFPLLGPQDRREGDLGFAIGKLPVEFQNGYMVRDEMAAVGVSKTHIRMEGSSGIRAMGLWAFDHINKADDAPDESDVNLFGLFVEGDFPWGLLEVDVARTVAGRDRGAQFNSGVGWTGHSAGNNYSVHANFSRFFDPAQVRYDSGTLLALGYSTEFGLRRDIVYANGYWAEGDFRRLASSGPPPLGPIGLSFDGVGRGGYRPALWPRPLDSAGFAVGMQTYFADEALNWAVELGHRQDLDKTHPMFGNTSGTALTTRAQYKLAARFLLQLDAFYAVHGRDSKGHQGKKSDDDSSALRVELRVNF